MSFCGARSKIWGARSNSLLGNQDTLNIYTSKINPAQLRELKSWYNEARPIYQPRKKKNEVQLITLPL